MVVSEEERGAPPSVVAPPPIAHRADIQGMRGLAVLLVVAFHAGLPLPGGYVGVDVFFVISGFVITQLLWRELASAKRLSFSTFYARRVRRILPALALLIVAVAVASAMFQNPILAQRKTAAAGAAAATFFANGYFYSAKVGYFDAALNSNPLLHTWSLSVEEQFYVVFPLLLALTVYAAGRYAPRLPVRTAVAWVIGIVGALSFFIGVGATRGAFTEFLTSPSRFAYYSSLTRAWEFAVGAFLALFVANLARMKANRALIAGVVGIVLVFWSARVLTSTTLFPGAIALVPVGGTALLIIAGLGTQRGVTRVLSSTPMVRAGDVSYGWYLWHWPAIVFTGILFSHSTVALTIAAVVALIPTYFSYRFVEQPIRFNRSITGRRALTVAIICISVPLIACAALGLSARAVSRTAIARNLKQQTTLHADEIRDCENNGPIESRPAGCVWHAADAHGSVWLVGDSNAGHFTEPVAAATTQAGYDLHVATSAGCPFVDLVLVTDGNALDGCRRFVTQAVTQLITLKPKLVIVSSDASGYIDGTKFRLRDPRTGRTATTVAAKAREWETALSSVVRRLTQAGVPVTIVDTIPHFGTWDLSQCPAFRIYLDASSCGTTASRASITRQQQPALQANRAAIAGIASANDIDLTNDLCTATECPTNHGDHFLYRDFGHLTIAGALTLTTEFSRMLQTKLLSA